MMHGKGSQMPDGKSDTTIAAEATAMEVGDTFSMDVTVTPRWWQFWRKPTVETRHFVVSGVVTSGRKEILNGR